MSTLALVLAQLLKLKTQAAEINRACNQLGLPDAIALNETGISASTDYRFEGFGVVVGLTPRIQFYLHHVPSETRVGRFLVPIAWGDVGKVGK